MAWYVDRFGHIHGDGRRVELFDIFLEIALPVQARVDAVPSVHDRSATVPRMNCSLERLTPLLEEVLLTERYRKTQENIVLTRVEK